MGRPATGGPRRIFGPVVGRRWWWSVVHGGVKVYRGNPAAARNYVDADHAGVDDYYLAEGTGLAERLVATPDRVAAVGVLDGDGYEAWVAGLDPLSREPRGWLRQDTSAVRFVEVVVNGPMTWSLAAALDPAVAEAYEAAQDRAARQIIGWLAQHTTTRVGPRGRQVQVPVERIEAASVRHYTFRASDPHRHLHLQINARVWAAGAWRGLHTVGVRDMIDAVHHNSTASRRMSSSIFGFRPPYEIRSISRPRTCSINCLNLMNANDDVPGGASTRRSMSES